MHGLAAGDIYIKFRPIEFVILSLFSMHVLAAGNTHMKFLFKTCSASMFSLQVIYLTVILKPVLRA